MYETTPPPWSAYSLVMRGIYTSSLMAALNRLTTADSSACGCGYGSCDQQCSGCGHLCVTTVSGIVLLEGFN